MKRPTLKLIIGVVLALAIIIYCIAAEPAKWIQESSLSWIVARAVAAVLAFVLGFLSFTSGQIKKGFSQLRQEKVYIADKTNDDLKKQGFSEFDILLIEAPLYAWLAWWIICFEVMTTFYVADWCPTGF